MTDTLTPAQIADLAKAALPAPWTSFSASVIGADGNEIATLFGGHDTMDKRFATAAFLSAAHDMAAMIAAQEEQLRELRDELEDAKDDLRGLRGDLKKRPG